MVVGLSFLLSVFALLSAVTLLVLAISDLLIASFRFWPPPKDQGWQKPVFMTLFRFMAYGLVFSSLLYLWQNGFQTSLLVNSLAGILIFTGFVGALLATGVLGWKTAFGAKEGLRTDGIFAYSRNPIYIATWFGLAGWALLVPAPGIIATLLCWALLYLVAIFLEERWLQQEYGEAFDEFCTKTRRFI